MSQAPRKTDDEHFRDIVACYGIDKEFADTYAEKRDVRFVKLWEKLNITCKDCVISVRHLNGLPFGKSPYGQYFNLLSPFIKYSTRILFVPHLGCETCILNIIDFINVHELIGDMYLVKSLDAVKNIHDEFESIKLSSEFPIEINTLRELLFEKNNSTRDFDTETSCENLSVLERSRYDMCMQSYNTKVIFRVRYIEQYLLMETDNNYIMQNIKAIAGQAYGSGTIFEMASKDNISKLIEQHRYTAVRNILAVARYVGLAMYGQACDFTYYDQVLKILSDMKK